MKAREDVRRTAVIISSFIFNTFEGAQAGAFARMPDQ
jgi:hypothetical protein